MECEHERKSKAAELNHRANDCPRRVIPFEEYVAHREAGKKALTAAKSTSLGEPVVNWDDEPLCPP